MVNRAYVGNLPFQFTSADLQQLFVTFGAVKHAEIVIDRETGRSRGFGFVEMETPESLQAAMTGLHGKPVGGRNLTVNEARERAPRGPGGFGGPGAGPPRGDRPPGGGFAPRAGGPPRPGGPPRGPGGGGGARPGGWGGGGGGGGDRPGARPRTEKDREKRLERPEKGRDDRWRYGKGGEDEE